MNEILLALIAMIVLWSVMWWIIKKRHGTYIEILITYPFDSLKVGKTAIFKSDEEIKVGDYVLIYISGYDMIWKVVEVYDREKLKLVNRGKEELVGFPKCCIRGKMVGYEGNQLEEDGMIESEFIANVPNHVESIFDKEDNKENQN